MAKSQVSGDFANVILAQLSHVRLTDLRQHLQRVELEVRKVIYEPNRPIDFAYFVETGMISVVSIMNDGASIEVGTIGKEGMTGACVLLGTKSVPYQHFVQMAGFGYSMKADTLKSEAAHNGEFRDLVLRSHSAFQTQTMQTAACNGLHSISQRCCRWILMSRDRMGSDTIALTHEFLGVMLGARRASVTDVLRPLQDRGWIQSKRGEITVLDRKGLESGSCECYRIITDQQKQLMN
jgi:CRP-like cAMP-binding protein